MNESLLQGGTVLGTPDRVESLGETEVPHSLFLDYVIALGDSTFGPAKFDRRKYNSNTFCKEVTLFLCGKEFPDSDDTQVLNIGNVSLNQRGNDCSHDQAFDNHQVPPDSQLSKEVSQLLDSETLISSKSVAISFGDRHLRERFPDSTAETDTVFRREAREASPEYEELQRQIEALRYAEETRSLQLKGTTNCH